MAPHFSNCYGNALRLVSGTKKKPTVIDASFQAGLHLSKQDKLFTVQGGTASLTAVRCEPPDMRIRK